MIRSRDDKSGDDDPTATRPTVDAPSVPRPAVERAGHDAPVELAGHGSAVERAGHGSAVELATAATLLVPSGSAAPGIAAGASRAPVVRVAQFVLLDRIGAGGMGEVFAAFDDKLERKVAIKLVSACGNEERAQQRLLREAQAQARLSHPNVVTIYEVGTLPTGGLFIAMELVKGQTLRDWQDGPHTWREVVAMYAEAGQGLAAAHAAGLVHRDFKPDNVLVGQDGRVRVADFGLAFAAGEPGPVDDGVAPARRGDSLTAAGRFAGTPGYMAPEQLAGTAIDARADQFSFCVALAEALGGERPAAWTVTDGELPARRGGDAERSYPRWLGDLLRRGMAADPQARFPTMAALLAELTRRRERGRRLALAVAMIGAAGVVAASSALVAGHSAPPPCPPATAELAGVWDPPVRQRSQAALLATAAPYAPAMWASTAAALDRYAGRWLDAERAACEATHVRHVQSAELLDRRMECLASRLRSLAAVSEVLQQRPGQAVAHAGELLSSLGDLEPCADTAALLDLPRTRSTPAPLVRSRAAAVRQRLASASAVLATGDVSGAASIAGAAERLAADLDDASLRAELQYVDGRIKLERGDLAEARSVFDRATALAVASHHDELAADLWLTLVVRAGAREQRPAEMESWLRQAESWIARIGHPTDARRIEVEHARAVLQSAAGDASGAAVTLSHALERAEALWGKDDPRLIPLLRARASAQGRLHEIKPATADAERALAIGIAAWGPAYPDVARSRRTLGLLYLEQPDAASRGEHELTLARETYRAQLGEQSIEVANCEQALTRASQYRGDYLAALAHAERADQIYAARLGADHPRRGEALVGVGALRYLRKDFAGALAAYEAAYPILRGALGSTHLNVGLLLGNTGEALLALGRFAAAQAQLAQGLDIVEHALGPAHPDVALLLKGLGLVELGRGRPREARAPLERALELRTQAAGGDPQELAEVRWALARTLRALGREPARARQLAEEAAAGYRSLGASWADRVVEIERWLSALPGR